MIQISKKSSFYYQTKLDYYKLKLANIAGFVLFIAIFSSFIFVYFQSDQSNEMYMPRPEDSHSQLSEDGDSGRGGSVSDGHMGVSQDGGT